MRLSVRVANALKLNCRSSKDQELCCWDGSRFQGQVTRHRASGKESSTPIPPGVTVQISP